MQLFVCLEKYSELLSIYEEQFPGNTHVRTQNGYISSELNDKVKTMYLLVAVQQN